MPYRSDSFYAMALSLILLEIIVIPTNFCRKLSVFTKVFVSIAKKYKKIINSIEKDLKKIQKY